MINDFTFIRIESSEPLIISNRTNKRCPDDNCHVEQNRSDPNVGQFLDRLYFSFQYEDHAYTDHSDVNQNSDQITSKISQYVPLLFRLSCSLS